MNVWILEGVDSHSSTVLGVFATQDLAELAKELDEDSYAFYSIRFWCVTDNRYPSDDSDTKL